MKFFTKGYDSVVKTNTLKESQEVVGFGMDLLNPVESIESL